MNFLNRARANSPSSRARKIASLRSYFKYLTKSGILEDNPIAELETIKLKKRYITHDVSLFLMSKQH